jgi:rod shape-determining protein MreC
MTVVSPIGDALHGVIDYGHLTRQNDDLRAEVERLRGSELSGEAATDELARLKEQLQLPPDVAGLPQQVARVTGGPAGNFEENVVEISKGSSSGLRKGMAVMTNAGLIGKLVQVDGERSVVQLVTAADFAVGVRIGDEVALARGRGSGTELRATEGLSNDNPVKVDDPVLTNGGTSSAFPPGVPVGRVSAVDRTSGAPVVTVALSADIANLDYVTVLLYEPTGG